MDFDINSASAFLSDFNTRVRDIEERHDLLRDRTIVLGETIIKQTQRFNKELSIIKEDIREARLELEKLKDNIKAIMHETENFARKEDLNSIQHYLKLWQPLKFTREEDVREIVQEELAKRRKHGRRA